MRRYLIFLPFALIACQALTQPLATPIGSLLVTQTASTPAGSTPQVGVPSPTITPDPGSLPTPSPSPPAEEAPGFTVLFHPDGGLYVGDQVSIEVITPQGVNLRENMVRVQVGAQDLGTADFKPYGLAGRSQATLMWVWDTRALEPGEYMLTFSTTPAGFSWSQEVLLGAQSQVPSPEPKARWETVESECCLVHYITGTAASRNLPALLDLEDEKSQQAAKSLGTVLNEPVPVTILPRVLGHGGFTGGEIYVSYLERNYAGSDFAQVLHHEIVHLLDSRLGGELRPSILVEGLAVYLAGGHFKPEPLLPRAATLLDLGWYLPLAPLADDFYNSQHEIGYIQAGALVRYLVDAYGWQAFDRFYRDIHPHPSDDQSQAIAVALQDHFGLKFEQLEDGFMAELRRQRINPDMYDDVRLTVAYYEAVRYYQQVLDPSAYFLTVWLPDGEQMRQRGIVADYLRHPSKPVNKYLESLLVQADKELRAGRYAEADDLIGMVNANLDAIEQSLPEPAGAPVPVPDAVPVDRRVAVER